MSRHVTVSVGAAAIIALTICWTIRPTRRSYRANRADKSVVIWGGQFRFRVTSASLGWHRSPLKLQWYPMALLASRSQYGWVQQLG